MARTSTPLSCLTFCSLCFTAVLADQPACDSKAPWAAAEADQSQGLELLQVVSRKVSTAARNGEDNAWQCHTYENGQDDDWCQEAKVQGGYEYSFEGMTGLCGDCWCCKRSVQAPKASVQEPEPSADDLSGPAWQCHAYDEDQDNDWCIEMAANKDRDNVEEEFEYSWTGGKVELRGCGDCWCCKRSAAWRVETAGLLMTKKETSLLSGVVTKEAVTKESQQAREQLALWKAAQWQCYDYNEEQDNDWCIGMTTKNLPEFEFAFTDGKVDLCGDCWCCRRTKINVLGLMQVESGRIEARSEEKQIAGADWQCHNYDNDQNDDWCSSAGTQGGFEYAFQSGQCGDCWCCKRTVEESAPPSTEVAPPVADSIPPVADSIPPVAAWQCHMYNNEENDEWCIGMANEGNDASFDFAYTGGEVDLCGDCWCCKRGKATNLAEQVEDVDKKAQDDQSLVKDDQSSVKDDQSLAKDADWTCHTYTEEQSDDWCMSAGIQGTFEYAFNGGKSNQCGDCWCCKREAKPWQCLTYDAQQNQDNDWCASTKQFGGYEIAYTGGETNLCGDCWCCKRERA